MSFSHFYILVLICTGLLLPAVAVVVAFLLESPYRPTVPERRRHLRLGALGLLCTIVALQGYEWAQRVGEYGLAVAASWGWERFVIAAAFALLPLAALLVLLRNRPGRPRRVVLIAVVGLSLVQTPVWLVFGLFALFDLLSPLLSATGRTLP